MKGDIMRTEINWRSKMEFEAELDSHHFTMDAGTAGGGTDKGPRPKGLLLSGLAGCSGMDVVSILEKMRVELDDLKISVDATLTEEHPKVFKDIEMTYEFYGKDLPEDKINKAVELSQEKYCGVSAILKNGASLSYQVKIINN